MKKKTIIKIGEEYYRTYSISNTIYFTKEIENAYVFKTKHDAVYYYKNILLNHGYEKPEYIEVK